MRPSAKWAAAGLSMLLFAACGAYRWPIDADRVSAQMNAVLPPVDGRHWARPGRAWLSLLPWPTLRIVGVELLDARNSSVLNVPNVEVALSPARLLRAELAPVSARLHNPTALIDLDAARSELAQIPLVASPPLQRVSIKGGVARIVSAQRRIDTLFESVDGWIEWTKVTRPLSFSLAGAWRGEPVHVEGRLDAALQLLRGGASGAKLSIRSAPAELDFAGGWAATAKPRFDGELFLRIDSVDALARALGLVAPSLAARSISLHANATGDADALALADARLEVGGQRFDGSLNISRLDGGLAASGTLAADALDLDAIWGAPPNICGTSGRWSSQPLLPASGWPDLDLRVSAARASWGGHVVEDAAVSVQRSDGHSNWKLLQATAYQGALSGALDIQGSGAEMRTRASIALDNADIGALLSEWGTQAFSGRGGFDATLSARGASPAELAVSATGSANLNLEGGAITGVNFEEALRRSARRRIDLARDMTIGQTKFASAHARFEIANGWAEIVEARMDGPGAIIEATGAIEIAARAWDARIEATQASALGTASVEAAHLTLALFGPWTAPTIAALANAY